MEKQKTTVRVAGKDYALVSTDSPEHLNRVAAYVDPADDGDDAFRADSGEHGGGADGAESGG